MDDLEELQEEPEESLELLEETPEDTEDSPEEDKEEKGDSGYPKEIEDAIIQLNDFFAKEDEGLRNQMMAFWKKLENYFDGIQRIFWNFDSQEWGRIDFNDEDPTRYDKIVNIYRAHGEAIIAALSVKLPTVNFYPDDADVTEDVDTAKAYSKASEIIGKHNEAALLFIKALFILFNQGTVAAYIYNRTKDEYGSVDVPEYGEDVNVKTHTLTCPVCRGFIGQFEEKVSTVADNQQPAIDAGTEEQPLESGQEESRIPGQTEELPAPEPYIITCPNCSAEVEPEDNLEEETVPQIVGWNKQSKARTVIDVFGPMYAQMPFYARNQETMPFIRLRFEQHFSILKSIYTNIEDKIPTNNDTGAYDRQLRTQNNFTGSYPNNLITTTCAWFRPWAFHVLQDEELILKMKSFFPDGCYAVILKDIVAEARNESLDKHWEISKNPLSNFVHGEPIGKPLAPIQEIINEINDLSLETFEHAIPETFADPDVLDFEKYKDAQALPGMKFPAKKPMNGKIADAFYTDKPAMMSDELKEFRKQNDNDAQFVVGSFPSIYGGPAGGSKTAREYTESRAMALQRLNTVWTMLKYWWAGVQSKAVPLFIEALVEDEKFVVKEGQTGYLNIWIKQAELNGKIGRVEPEASEELPSSFAQYKTILLELITLNNEALNSAIFNPANTPNVAKALGWAGFYLPGQDDRDKQYSEISLMLKGEWVEPEIGVDDDQTHISSIRTWAVSAAGRATKIDNPEGYNMVIQHGFKHYDNMMMMQAENSTTPAGEPPASNSGSIVE